MLICTRTTHHYIVDILKSIVNRLSSMCRLMKWISLIANKFLLKILPSNISSNTVWVLKGTNHAFLVQSRTAVNVMCCLCCRTDISRGTATAGFLCAISIFLTRSELVKCAMELFVPIHQGTIVARPDSYLLCKFVWLDTPLEIMATTCINLEYCSL